MSGIIDIIKQRRSIRKYDKRKVPLETIKQLIEAGIYAPTGSNIQPWYFIIIDDDKVCSQIKAFSPGLLGGPPNLIIVCSDRKKAYERGGAFARDEWSVMDVSMASQNILLMAAEKGIATCAVKSYNKEAVKKILSLPEEVSVDLIISLGYSDQNPSTPSRKSVDQVTFINQWGNRNG
jgi:nitroreductase